MITDVVAEWNGLGYSGTNSSGEIYIVDSVWRYNVAGIVPNTLDTELLPPFHDVTIAGNLVHDNGNPRAPSFTSEWAGYGNGIILAGGNDSLVFRNRVVNHPANGIAITPNLSRNFWMSAGNRVAENVVEGSGRADIALAGPAASGNCFAGNEAALHAQSASRYSILRRRRVSPGCSSSPAAPSSWAASPKRAGLEGDHHPEMVPKPGPQENMPVDAPVRPAVARVRTARPDLESISVPGSAT